MPFGKILQPKNGVDFLCNVANVWDAPGIQVISNVLNSAHYHSVSANDQHSLNGCMPVVLAFQLRSVMVSLQKHLISEKYSN